MTASEFVIEIENTYKEYSEGMRVAIADGLTKFTDKQLDILYRYITIHHESGFPPNLAKIYNYVNKAGLYAKTESKEYVYFCQNCGAIKRLDDYFCVSCKQGNTAGNIENTYAIDDALQKKGIDYNEFDDNYKRKKTEFLYYLKTKNMPETKNIPEPEKKPVSTEGFRDDLF